MFGQCIILYLLHACYKGSRTSTIPLVIKITFETACVISELITLDLIQENQQDDQQ
jgi:hypothetical protein